MQSRSNKVEVTSRLLCMGVLLVRFRTGTVLPTVHILVGLLSNCHMLQAKEWGATVGKCAPSECELKSSESSLF